MQCEWMGEARSPDNRLLERGMELVKGSITLSVKKELRLVVLFLGVFWDSQMKQGGMR